MAEPQAQEKVEQSCTVSAPIVGAITVSTLEIVKKVRQEAEKRKCTQILLNVNTPGGEFTKYTAYR